MEPEPSADIPVYVRTQEQDSEEEDAPDILAAYRLLEDSEDDNETSSEAKQINR